MAAALGIPERERNAFVSAQCEGDTELEVEVLSLLDSFHEAGEFLEPPPQSLAETMEMPSDTLEGARMGSYRLIRELGRGGMGSVYLAARDDNAFEKQVAVKLIREGMQNEFILRRFRHERQILARLEHPNIARLLDGGTTSDGLPYFVMEYVPGKPLVQHCESRSLWVGDRVQIFLEVCSAVHYAHRRMIVHRDLKPGNILVTAEGTPKLLDFGIAKIVDPEPTDPEITLTGIRMVTPAYASPEQLRGEPATVQSDIYSLGIVLWELISGRRAMRENGRLSFDPPDLGPDAPAWLLVRNIRNIVQRAVRDNPAERYESCDALSRDIQIALEGGEVPPYGAARPTLHIEPPPPGSIAVLPFQMLGSDAGSEEYLGLGIADAIITRLSNVGRIVVRPTGAVLKFTGPSRSQQAATELRVEYVLEGRIRKANGRVRVTVQLVETDAQSPVWADTLDEPFEDLLKVEESISERVAQALIPRMTGEERNDLARSGTTSAKAHQAYLRGRWYWSQHTEEAMPQALVLFTEAVTEDPRYARAHAGIADYHIALGVWSVMNPRESFGAAIESARTAIELDPKFAEAYVSLGLALWVSNGDREAAAHHWQLAIALNPESAHAHAWFGLLNSACNRPNVALASVERARRLEPNTSMYAADLALCYYNNRQYDRALASFLPPSGDAGMVVDPPPVINGAVQPLCYLAQGETARALESAHAFAGIMKRGPWALAVLARVEAAAGQHAEARAILAELESRAADYYVPGVALALAYLASGRKMDALRELERACRDRDLWTMYLAQNPVWDDLRTEPRFERMVMSSQSGQAIQTGRDRILASRGFWIAVWAATLFIAALVLYGRFRSAPPAFQNARVSKLTTNGLAERAAISPDGLSVAYILRQDGKASLWMRRLSDGGATRIAGPFEGRVPMLQFTRHGADVAFMITPVNDARAGVVQVIPSHGGQARTLISGVVAPPGVSPDESSVVFYGEDSKTGDDLLEVVSPGRDESPRILRRLKAPESYPFELGPVWSPDGQSILTAVRGPSGPGFGHRLEVIELDGSIRSVPGPLWQTLSELSWFPDRRSVLIAGQDVDQPFQQIWQLPLTGRGWRQLTNDLSNYTSVSVDEKRSTLVSVQAQTFSNLYVQPGGDSSRVAQITPGQGRYFDVAWMPNGNLLYASDATGAAEIWTMDAHGNGQRQLTNGPARSYAPSVAPDGLSIVFHSNRNGVWNVWKMNPDGSSAMPLTRDKSDSTYPQITADGHSALYHHVGMDTLISIWKVPLIGGSPTQLTTALTMYPTPGPDGRLAAWFCQDPSNPRWQLAIFDKDVARPDELFAFPSNRMPNEVLRWVPGQNAISYSENRSGVTNIWVQPVTGGMARQVTSFTSGRIYSFDWSRDGRLVFSRGTTTSDVVLLRDAAGSLPARKP
ncbi:MAG TPA: protein kinase [Bryobacteraceae bacterium]|nr:protein kinase [Bryobacteraceae bacterium]